jgi:hypothetical protein
MTSTPSTANLGAEKWISSLPASHANRSLLPERTVDLTMTVGSGLQSQELSLRYDRVSLCWKTCHQLFDTDYPLSSQTLPNSGSMRNGDCIAQPMLEPLTDGNDGGVWPTPTAFDSSTPANISPEARERQLRRGDPNGSRRTSSGSLAKEVLWPTPVANDTQRSPQAALEAKLRMGGNRTEITSLNVMSKLWPTPAAYDAKMTGQIQNGRHSEMLPGVAVMWPTPTAGIAHRGTDPERTNDRAGAPTFKAVAMGFSHQHATTPQPGHDGSPKVDLNPWFVASLMGLPADWLTHSTSAVTDSCRKQQQKQSDNYSTGAGGSYD